MSVIAELEMEEQEEEQEQGGYITEVKDLPTAVEASRRAQFLQVKQAEIDAIVAEQVKTIEDKVAKIKAWGEEAKKEYIERQQKYIVMLEEYVKQEIEKQEAKGLKKIKKSIKLPYGTISMKAVSPEFKRNDEELMNFAVEHDLVTIPEPKIEWGELKKKAEVMGGVMIFGDDAEIVPGVEVVQKPDKFQVKWEV